MRAGGRVIIPSSAAATMAGMSTIVLLEENDLMRALLTEWLCAANHSVFEQKSAGGPPASQADLIIIDIGLPRRTAEHNTAMVRKMYPRTPIVAVSGHFRTGLSSAGLVAQSHGVDHVIAIPLTREVLLDAIEAVIARAARVAAS